MSEDIADVAVAVLAGGCGSRIGGRKPLHILGNRQLIDRAVERAQSWSERVATIVRDPDQVGTLSCELIQDTPATHGPLAALTAGLGWAVEQKKKVLLTIPCDMPFLPDDLPYRLIRSIGTAMAALAASGGHLHPVCGLWKVGVLNLVPDYIAAGRSSLRGLAGLAGFTEVEWRGEKPDPFFNINSAADLEAAEAILKA